MSSLSEIRNSEGRGNELVSLYVQPDDSLSNIRGIIEQEIKSSEDFDENERIKYSVQETLRRMKEELDTIEEIPDNGLVILGGRIDGDTELYTFTDELVSPVNKTRYLTGRQFSTGQLEDLVPIQSSDVLVLMELGKCIIASLQNNKPNVQTVIESRINSKHSKGGQSQGRFERRREEQKKQFFSDCKKSIRSLLDEIEQESKIFVAGPEITLKEFLSQFSSDSIEFIKFPSIQYVNESGVRRLAELASEYNENQINENQLQVLEDFFRYIKTDDKPVVYGEETVETAVSYGAVRKLLVHTEFEYSKLLQEAERKGAEVVVIDGDSEKEQIFLESFGGIGAVLNYEIGQVSE